MKYALFVGTILVSFIGNAYSKAIIIGEYAACPSWSQIKEHFDQVYREKNYAHQLDSACVYLKEGTYVDGPYKKKQYKFPVGSVARYVQISVPGEGRVKVLEKAKKYSLYVNTDPPDSIVKIINIKPSYYFGIKLVPGRYDILVSKPGYYSHKERITIEDSGKYIEVKLKEKEDRGKAPLTVRVKTSLGHVANSVKIYGGDMVIVTSHCLVKQPEYLGVIRITCKEIGENSERLSAIVVTNRHGGQGWIYRHPDKCAKILESEGNRFTLSVLGDTDLL